MSVDTQMCIRDRSIPKSDIKFFKELAKKMGWDIDIREDFLKDYIASRPKRVNLSEEEIRCV